VGCKPQNESVATDCLCGQRESRPRVWEVVSAILLTSANCLFVCLFVDYANGYPIWVAICFLFDYKDNTFILQFQIKSHFFLIIFFLIYISRSERNEVSRLAAVYSLTSSATRIIYITKIVILFQSTKLLCKINLKLFYYFIWWIRILCLSLFHKQIKTQYYGTGIFIKRKCFN
jgi:hypothetical protein